MISNRTGRLVFCWITIARVRNSPPATRSPILIFTRSQPRNLLSIARSNSARSRSRCCRSKWKRIAQICRGFNGRFAPTFRPAFHAGRGGKQSNSDLPMIVLLRPKWPQGETRGLRRWPVADAPLSGGRMSKADTLTESETYAATPLAGHRVHSPALSHASAQVGGQDLSSGGRQGYTWRIAGEESSEPNKNRHNLC